MSKNKNKLNSNHGKNFIPLIFFFILGHCWTAAMVQPQSSTHQPPIQFTSLLNTVATIESTEIPTVTATPGQMSTIDPTSSIYLFSSEQRPSNSRFPRNSNRNSKSELIARVRQIPPERLHRYKVEAARQLQVSLIRTFQVLSGSATAAHRVPNNIRGAARKALFAAQAGNYNVAIVNHLPTILRLGSQQQGQPAKQLQAILATIIPHVPPTSRGQLQGILGFLSTKITIANTLLTSVLGTVPDLLSGVIKSLTNNLGAVTGALNGTLASLGSLLGGILG